MGDERGGHGHQRSVFKYRQVAPLKIVDGGVFHGDVVVPVLQRSGKTVVPGTAPNVPDGREGLGGNHMFPLFLSQAADQLCELSSPCEAVMASPRCNG